MSQPIEYIKQKDTFRCVPHAFINAMKWAGADFSAKQWLPLICQQMDTQKNVGTYLDNALKVIDKHSKGYFKRGSILGNPSLRVIKSYLNNGNALIMGHLLPFEDALHVSFIPELKASKFLLVNSFVDSMRDTATVFECDEQLFLDRVIRRNKTRKDSFFIIPVSKLKSATVK